MSKLTNEQLTQKLAECKLEVQRLNHDLLEINRVLKKQQVFEEKIELYEKTLEEAKAAVSTLVSTHYPPTYVTYDQEGIAVKQKKRPLPEWQEKAFYHILQVLRKSEQIKRSWV